MFIVKKLKITGYLALTLITSIVSPGYSQSAVLFPVKKSGDSVQYGPAPDKALLAKFEILNKKLNDVKGNYTLAGVISILDHANPAAKMDHVKFLFCKQGGSFYYRLGTTATINEQGAYLYIDYRNKRILISGKKRVTYDTGLKPFGDLGADIQSEQYQLKRKISGNDETISLINEHHISCKQYSITFRRHDMQIERLYMRLSDFNDPLRTDNEETVDVNISRWDHAANLKKYLTKNMVIKNVNGNLKTTKMFNNYRLIKM